jgi:uncharacterized protein YcbX
VRAHEWLRDWLPTQSRLTLSDEQMERQFRFSVESADRDARAVLQQRTDVVVQRMSDGLQLWVERYRDPETEKTIDRELSPLVAVALDLEWDPESRTIGGLEPSELVEHVAESFLDDPDALTFEIR